MSKLTKLYFEKKDQKVIFLKDCKKYEKMFDIGN
jgi:hypothetical protein